MPKKVEDIGDWASLSKPELGAIKEKLIEFNGNIEMVKAYMQDVYEVQVSAQTLKRIQAHYGAELAELKEKYYSGPENVPCFHLAVRLRRFEEIFHKRMVPKIRYSVKTGSDECPTWEPVKDIDSAGAESAMRAAAADAHRWRALNIEEKKLKGPAVGSGGNGNAGASSRIAQFGRV